MSRSTRGHIEIAGAGFAGLAAAVALAQRGWSVRVHEKTQGLRAEGFAIALQPNTMRVLEALGVQDDVIAGGLRIKRRETRNEHNQVTMSLPDPGAYRVSRQHIVNVLANAAQSYGAIIETESAVRGADASGTLLLANGQRLDANLVIAADGIHSCVRDSLNLISNRQQLPDGAIRTLVSRASNDAGDAEGQGPTTCEYWSGTRRVITSPCSSTELYVVLSCLASDTLGRVIPCDVPSWSAAFPHLTSLFERVALESDQERMRWSGFETIRLNRWSSGRVAILGDAAHAMPPNLGQGSGCAMMNALALAVALDESSNIEDALTYWEQRERALIEHTQTWSMRYGRVTTWPSWARSAAFKAMGNIVWVRSRYQRTANHIPTGYQPTP